MTQRLDRQNWISAGLKALAAQGVDAVRVERLAQALKVTKGSFYWHFKDRGALLSALLDAWRERATQAVIEEVEAAGGDATHRLRTLFTIVTPNDGRLDLAMRAWAAQDPAAKAAVDAVDEQRLRFLEAQFLDLGFSPPAAAARARLAYHALVGQFILDKSTPDARLTERLEQILPMLVRK